VLLLRCPDPPATAGGVKRLSFADAGVAACDKSFDAGVLWQLPPPNMICFDAGVPWSGVVVNRENMVESERMPVGEANGGEAKGGVPREFREEKENCPSAVCWGEMLPGVAGTCLGKAKEYTSICEPSEKQEEGESEPGEKTKALKLSADSGLGRRLDTGDPGGPSWGTGITPLSCAIFPGKACLDHKLISKF